MSNLNSIIEEIELQLKELREANEKYEDQKIKKYAGVGRKVALGIAKNCDFYRKGVQLLRKKRGDVVVEKKVK